MGALTLRHIAVSATAILLLNAAAAAMAGEPDRSADQALSGDLLAERQDIRQAAAAKVRAMGTQGISVVVDAVSKAKPPFSYAGELISLLVGCGPEADPHLMRLAKVKKFGGPCVAAARDMKPQRGVPILAAALEYPLDPKGGDLNVAQDAARQLVTLGRNARCALPALHAYLKAHPPPLKNAPTPPAGYDSQTVSLCGTAVCAAVWGDKDGSRAVTALIPIVQDPQLGGGASFHALRIAARQGANTALIVPAICKAIAGGNTYFNPGSTYRQFFDRVDQSITAPAVPALAETNCVSLLVDMGPYAAAALPILTQRRDGQTPGADASVKESLRDPGWNNPEMFLTGRSSIDPVRMRWVARQGGSAARLAPRIKIMMDNPSGDEQIRCEAARAYWLATGDSDAAIKVLVSMLKHSSASIRAGEALAEMGPRAKAALPAIVEACGAKVIGTARIPGETVGGGYTVQVSTPQGDRETLLWALYKVGLEDQGRRELLEALRKQFSYDPYLIGALTWFEPEEDKAK